MRAHGKCLLRKPGRHVHSRRPDNVSCRTQCQLHWRQRIRHKLPVIVLPDGAERSGLPDRFGLGPMLAGAGLGAVPAPIEHCSIDSLSRFGDIVVSENGIWSGQDLDALFFFHIPRCIGVGYSVYFRLSLEEKSGRSLIWASGESTPKFQTAAVRTFFPACRNGAMS